MACSPKRVVLGDNPHQKLLFALPEGPVPLGGAKTGKQSSALKSGSGSGGNNVLRTIYLPNETADSLKLMIQSLRTQLEEQRVLYEQKTQALMEDRCVLRRPLYCFWL
jgi:hypothetical protein